MDNKTSTQSTQATPSPVVSFAFLITYLVLLSSFGSFVNDMYVPCLPDMRHHFGCSVSVAQLGLTCGMIGLALGQIIFGPLSDKYGRKIVLYVSLSIFILGAVVSIFSPTIHFFNVCRIFQGFGASGAYFLARTVPADYYGGRQLAKTMALIGAINGFAPASAPVLGGLCARTIGWQGIFWILTAFAGVLLGISFIFKESLPKQRRFQGPLPKAFSEYMVLLKNRNFITHVLLKGAALGLMFAYVSAAPFIIEEHFGFTPMQFGFFMGVNALFVVGGAMAALKFKELKTGAFVAGWILFAATAIQVCVLLFTDSVWLFEGAMIPMLFALGMIFTVSNTLAMNEGRSDAGSASAVLGVGGYAFGALASPLVGIGNILHSTAIVIGILSVIVLVFAILSRRIAPLPSQDQDL